MAESQERGQRALARQLLLDRRTKIRFPCDLLAGCRAGAGRTGILWPAVVRDVSLKGIGLVMAREFSPGSVLTVKLHRGQGPVLLTVQARVVFVRPDAAGWIHGCQLGAKLGESELEALLS